MAGTLWHQWFARFFINRMRQTFLWRCYRSARCGWRWTCCYRCVKRLCSWRFLWVSSLHNRLTGRCMWIRWLTSMGYSIQKQTCVKEGEILNTIFAVAIPKSFLLSCNLIVMWSCVFRLMRLRCMAYRFTPAVWSHFINSCHYFMNNIVGAITMHGKAIDITRHARRNSYATDTSSNFIASEWHNNLFYPYPYPFVFKFVIFYSNTFQPLLLSLILAVNLCVCMDWISLSSDSSISRWKYGN